MYALDGITVVTLESGVSGPLCTRMLGDLGAEVVKIERPGVGDNSRHWDSTVRGHSSAHVWVNRNKQSVELNLKDEKGKEIFRQIASTADIVVQNLSPGVVERLDLDYESLLESEEEEIDNDLIYVNISGYGRSGPYKDRKAYDLVMQGETGLILMNGHPEAPAKIPLSICDINAAMYATIGSMTALYQREVTGEGQEMDITMFGGILSWLGYFPLKYWYDDELPERVGMRHHLLTPYGPYETADDQYVSFAVLSEAHYEIFCEEIIDRPDLLKDGRFASNEKRMQHRDEFESEIEEEIDQYPREYWVERFDDADIPWGEVNRVDDVLSHPQTEHLGLIEEIQTDDGPIKIIDNPLDMEKADTRRDKMPELGEDTVEVLSDLGYTPEEIAQFELKEII